MLVREGLPVGTGLLDLDQDIAVVYLPPFYPTPYYQAPEASCQTTDSCSIRVYCKFNQLSSLIKQCQRKWTPESQVAARKCRQHSVRTQPLSYKLVALGLCCGSSCRQDHVRLS